MSTSSLFLLGGKDALNDPKKTDAVQADDQAEGEEEEEEEEGEEEEGEGADGDATAEAEDQQVEDLENEKHKVHILEYHSVCPLVGIGTSHPLSRKRVCPPPGTKRGHPCEGVGESQFQRTGEKA
jgi:hypothetical protein